MFLKYPVLFLDRQIFILFYCLNYLIDYKPKLFFLCCWNPSTLNIFFSMISIDNKHNKRNLVFDLWTRIYFFHFVVKSDLFYYKSVYWKRFKNPISKQSQGLFVQSIALLQMKWVFINEHQVQPLLPTLLF